MKDNGVVERGLAMHVLCVDVPLSDLAFAAFSSWLSSFDHYPGLDD
jgi:hypothetical protein